MCPWSPTVLTDSRLLRPATLLRSSIDFSFATDSFDGPAFETVFLPPDGARQRVLAREPDLDCTDRHPDCDWIISRPCRGLGHMSEREDVRLVLAWPDFILILLDGHSSLRS